MRILTIFFLVATLTLSACTPIGESRLNPFNWSGGGGSGEVVGDAVPASQTQTLNEEPNPLIPEQRTGVFRATLKSVNAYLGTPIDQVSALVIEPVPGGAILRATGITQVQGVYNLRLTPTNLDDVADENGVLTYRIEGVRPARAVQGGPERLRTVMVARHLTDKQLEDARVIRVQARRNAQETTRR